jgi:hypothetical protein
MVSMKQDQINCRRRDHRDWSLLSLEIEAELEKVDHDAGHAYIPMDVFVDKKTIRRHFQMASIRPRLEGARTRSLIRHR